MTSEAPLGPTGPKITGRRSFLNSRGERWTVSEFASSGHVILTADALGNQFSAHFDAAQWRAFQVLVAPHPKATASLLDAATGEGRR